MKATFLLVFFFLLINFSTVKADISSIFISEVLPDATGTDTGKEYIEIYNSQTTSVNLEGWYLLNYSQSGTSKKVVLPTMQIKPKEYFLVAEDLSVYGNVSGISIGNSKLAFYNDFGKIQLFDSTGNIQHEFIYGDSKEGSAWEFGGPLCYSNIVISALNTPGKESNNIKSECFNLPSSYPQSSITAKISFSTDNTTWVDTTSEFVNTPIYFKYEINSNLNPGSVKWLDAFNNQLTNPYSFTTKYNNVINLELGFNNEVRSFSSKNITIQNPISNKVLITEVYPNPESPDKEWLEIYNADKLDILLSNYYIEEKSSTGITNRRLKLPDIYIKPGEYYVLTEDNLNITLNNSGDEVYILDINGNSIDSFIYKEIDKSKSIGKLFQNGSYSNQVTETSSPTPGGENKFFDSQSSSQEVTLSKIKDLKGGAIVYLQVHINNLIDKFAFLEDTTARLKVKTTDILSSELVNTIANIKGKVITYNGAKTLEISSSDIEVVDYFNPNYVEVNLLELTLNDVGRHISLQGEIQEVYSNRIKLSVQSKQISIYTNKTFNSLANVKGKVINVNGTIDFYRGSFRVIEIETDFSQILGIQEFVNTPISYTQKDSLDFNKLIPTSNNTDYSQSLVIFGYVTIVFIIITELFRNRNQIKKYFNKKIKGYSQLLKMNRIQSRFSSHDKIINR